jgi:UDP-N-acetylglucosamine 2-epimerase (non-hydrolysing)
MPWPEEDNRVAIDAGADLLFAPTETSAANLRAEQVAGAIHVTGNTGIDALRCVVGHLPPLTQPRLGGLPRLLVTCHRRENWGTAFLPVALALLELARSPWLGIDVVLHPNPAQADLMRMLLSGNPRIRLVPPLDHRGMIAAMLQSTIILSDSGGVQEEAPALGVPLLVLRSKTERPEGVDCGSMLLVGTDTDRIVGEVRRLLEDEAACAEMAVPRLPFGDGHAAVRIARVITDWLDAREQEGVRLTA